MSIVFGNLLAEFLYHLYIMYFFSFFWLSSLCVYIYLVSSLIFSKINRVTGTDSPNIYKKNIESVPDMYYVVPCIRHEHSLKIVMVKLLSIVT